MHSNKFKSPTRPLNSSRCKHGVLNDITLNPHIRWTVYYKSKHKSHTHLNKINKNKTFITYKCIKLLWIFYYFFVVGHTRALSIVHTSYLRVRKVSFTLIKNTNKLYVVRFFMKTVS